MIALVLAAVLTCPSPTSSPVATPPALSAQFDVDSYDVVAARRIELAPSSFVKTIAVTADVVQYYRPVETFDRRDETVSLSATTRSRLNVAVKTGSQYFLDDNGALRPSAQIGTSLTWNYGSAMPTTFSYSSQTYGSGRLDSSELSTTLRAGARLSLALEVDDLEQRFAGGARYGQRAERASVTYRHGDTSFSAGIGHVSGYVPDMISVQPYQNAWNVAATYTQRIRGGELTVTYGDASTYSTVRGFAIKLVRYAGGNKPA